MSEIDELLKLSNRGHDRMSGLAKLCVMLTVISVGFGVLFFLVVGVAAIIMK